MTPKKYGAIAISSDGDETEPQLQVTQQKRDTAARVRLSSTAPASSRSGPVVDIPREVDWDIAAAPDALRVVAWHQRDIIAGGGTRRPGFELIAPIVTVTTAGRVGIGVDAPQAELDVNGVLRMSVLEVTGGADLAESFIVNDEMDPEPGFIMVIDPRNPGALRVSKRSYDRAVAGVVTGACNSKPGVTLATPGDHRGVLIALAGRVWCRAETTTGDIQPGDLLTTSDHAGHAMRASNSKRRPGAILGKAMSALHEERGFVLALVNLQ